MIEFVLSDDCPQFKMVEFNPRRFARGAEAVRMDVDGEWIWMSRKDIDANIRIFGRHPELVKAQECYQQPRVPMKVQKHE